MRPIVLTILDGWGYSKETTGNAIANAQTPVLNEIYQKFPTTLLQASGPAVGMTFGEPGNSEVGHLTLGSGRIIFQYLTRINKAISNGEFVKNPALEETAHHVQKNNSTLHIAGLLTSGAVHAYFDHLLALVEFAKANNINFQIHLFTDGRDSGLKESPELLKKLSDRIGGLDNLVSIIGRDLAMDRDNKWTGVQAAYELLASGKGQPSNDIYKTLEEFYAQNIHDADIPAISLKEHAIKDGDSLIFFNFREDSMREIVQAFVDPKFDKFKRTLPANLYVASMTQYLESPELHALFPPPAIPHPLAEVLSANGKKQYHIAETDKYAHVTYFFNGLRNTPYEQETDLFVESLPDPIANPQMKAAEIANHVVSELDRDGYDFYVINFANGDILAHLGNLEAAIKGVEAVDAAIGTLKQKILEKNGVMLITADHGNVESMIYKATGEQETKHDDNPVHFVTIGNEFENKGEGMGKSEISGLLSDVAPTVLELMGIQQPEEMTGTSLVSKFQ